MNNKLILIDLWTSELKLGQNLIEESIKKNNGKLVIENVLLTETDAPNSNNRIYPHEYFSREVSLYEDNMIGKGRAIMELDHPERAEFYLKEGCSRIVGISWNNNKLYGNIEVMDYTPNGKIMEGYLRNGVVLGVSSRSLGTTMYREGFNYVQSDLSLLGWDVVSNPSVKPASFTLKGSLNESVIYEQLGYSKDVILAKKLQSFLCKYKGVCKI